MERKIAAKILRIQKDTLTKGIGLFSGEMGVCLALYLLGKGKDMPQQTEEEADKLLEHIVCEIKKTSNPTFGNGLSGIGWAINLLHAKECIEGDIDDVLHDIDATLYKELTLNGTTSNISLVNGVLGYLVYLANRLENVAHSTDTIQHQLIVEATHMTIDRIYELMPQALARASKDLYITVLWEVPLLFIHLAKVYKLGIYQEKIRNMIKCWEIYIQNAIPYYSTNKCYLVASLGYMNQWFKEPYINKHIDLLIHAIDFEEIKHEINFHVININEGWPFTTLILYLTEKHIANALPKTNCLGNIRKEILKRFRTSFLESLDRDKEKNISPSFINGLSGIAVANTIYPNAFTLKK